MSLVNSISGCNINLTEICLFFAVILVISSVATAAGAWGLITDNQHVSFLKRENQRLMPNSNHTKRTCMSQQHDAVVKSCSMYAQKA